MPGTLAITLDKPIESAAISGPGVDSRPPEEIKNQISKIKPADSLAKDIESQKVRLESLCRTLENIISELNRSHEQMIAQQPEQVAKLSVEIARKILTRRIQNGDYKIETILKEALKNAPTHTDIVVRLNPQDLAQCQRLQQDEPDSDFANIKFVADANIGAAECVIETPKGIVKSLIDEHLARIEEALAKVK
jgi:flagellar biosynthesis/type III secretory pathway protein FliH